MGAHYRMVALHHTSPPVVPTSAPRVFPTQSLVSHFTNPSRPAKFEPPGPTSANLEAFVLDTLGPAANTTSPALNPTISHAHARPHAVCCAGIFKCGLPDRGYYHGPDDEPRRVANYSEIRPGVPLWQLQPADLSNDKMIESPLAVCKGGQVEVKVGNEAGAG